MTYMSHVSHLLTMNILTTKRYNKRHELQHDDLLLNICLKAESVLYPTNNALQ